MDASPRVADFVQSQTANLPFYRTQGAALLSSYLSAQRPPPPAAAPVDRHAPSTASNANDDSALFRVPSSPPATPQEVHRGADGVDVLNAARAGNYSVIAAHGQAGHRAQALVRPPTGSGRRLIDRMKGRDGLGSAKGATVKRSSARKEQTSGLEAAGKSMRVGSRESSVVVTKKELKLKQHPGSTALSPLTSPPQDKTSPPKQSKHLAADDRSSQSDLLEMERAPPTPPPTARRPSDRQSAKRMSKRTVRELEAPCPPAVPERNHDGGRKRKASDGAGLENLGIATAAGAKDDEAARRIVRLEERKMRRRAKAAIVNPRQPSRSSTPSSGSASASSFAHPARRAEADDTAQDRKRRRIASSSSPMKLKGGTKGKTRRSGKAKGKENLGARLGLGAISAFKASNVVDGRLTLWQGNAAKPGVFSKGMASSKVIPSDKVRGVSDLVFSETAFFGRPRPSAQEFKLKNLSPVSTSSSIRSSSPTKRPRSSSASSSVAASCSKAKEVQQARASPQKESGRVSRFFSSARTTTTTAQKPDAGPTETVEASSGASEKRRYSPSWPESVAASDDEAAPSRLAPASPASSPKLHSPALVALDDLRVVLPLSPPHRELPPARQARYSSPSYLPATLLPSPAYAASSPVYTDGLSRSLEDDALLLAPDGGVHTRDEVVVLVRPYSDEDYANEDGYSVRADAKEERRYLLSNYHPAGPDGENDLGTSQYFNPLYVDAVDLRPAAYRTAAPELHVAELSWAVDDGFAGEGPLLEGEDVKSLAEEAPDYFALNPVAVLSPEPVHRQPTSGAYGSFDGSSDDMDLFALDDDDRLDAALRTHWRPHWT